MVRLLMIQIKKFLTMVVMVLFYQWTHIKNYRVVGEVVVCTNFLGRTYYTNILNWSNNPNNNIQTEYHQIKKVNLPGIPLNYNRLTMPTY